LEPLKIGITGGIGSGKTTVCKIFETLGIPVYYADERAKSLMTNDLELIKNIKILFGATAYENGILNRSHIAQIAFSDPQKLGQLNALVHPAVLRDGEIWQEAQGNVPYTLKEAALLFESGSYKQLDKIIVVTAPLEERIERVMQRDQVFREEVEVRIAKQMSEEEKIKRADFIIKNDNAHPLIPQVLAIHKELSKFNAAQTFNNQ
jgi:dephospho-CoA kinase